MNRELVAKCPRCNHKLIATKLNCENCDMELQGNFSLSKFDYLSNNEMRFVECFLKQQGNFKAVQNEIGMSYPAVKKKLANILGILELNSESENRKDVTIKEMINYVTIFKTDSRVIKMIKEKLNTSNGIATIRLYQGDTCDIWFDKDGDGLICPKIPIAKHLTWQVLDAAVEVVINNGGKAKKGNAQSGAKLGSDKLMLNSVEGYIAHKVHAVQIGETAFGPGFIVYSILDWAGICKNERGYLRIVPSFLANMKE
jgi:hypothetical protein